MKNCVVRSYGCGSNNEMQEKLAQGWTVKFANPIAGYCGKDSGIEYILEEPDSGVSVD